MNGRCLIYGLICIPQCVCMLCYAVLCCGAAMRKRRRHVASRLSADLSLYLGLLEPEPCEDDEDEPPWPPCEDEEEGL